MAEYPEHEKLAKVHDKSQAIGEFLEWLADERDFVLAVRHQHTEDCIEDCGARRGELIPLAIPVHKLLAEFFDIDEDKLDDEKRAMLEELRRGDKDHQDHFHKSVL